MKYLQGKKTYVIAGLGMVYAVIGWFLGYLAPQEAIEVFLGASGLAGLRATKKLN